MAANAGETKVKLWEGICYPENMRDDWQDEIDDILQVPFAYAVHDIDHDQKSKQRKTHAHVIVVWGGNTTRKAIINVLNRLSADGKKCCSSAEPINNIRHAYDYLIHDTASCRKKGKELYPVEARAQHRESGERGGVRQGDRGVPEDRAGAEQNPKGGGAALHRYAASRRHRPDRQCLHSRNPRWDSLHGELRADRTGRQVAVQPGRHESEIARYYGLLL